MIDTKRLEGGKLDFWVARAQGKAPRLIDGSHCFVEGKRFAPSKDWTQGGKLFESLTEREKPEAAIWHDHNTGCWDAMVRSYVTGPQFAEIALASGGSPLEAFCRAFVLANFGAEFDPPPPHYSPSD